MDFMSLHVSFTTIRLTERKCPCYIVVSSHSNSTSPERTNVTKYSSIKTRQKNDRSLTTSFNCTAQGIDCRIYFTLHRIQRVHLLQSGVIYKPNGLTVSFSREQIQSALMQKHVLSLRERERQISNLKNDPLTLVYTITFAR